MSGTLKTTVYLDAASYEAIKGVARERGIPSAEVVREAVAEYARRHARRRKVRSVGAFRSGKGNLSERADELLSGMGRSR
ncbi:MAG: ribbon-helix-helix protein, CopG family [Thermoanaerobaculia bacterium]|nr:ribbon-helix-helix protein, CopG family [Thermoanaerobaculia bacterium]